MADLGDRRGFHVIDELKGDDPGIYNEIRQSIIDIILEEEALAGPCNETHVDPTY